MTECIVEQHLIGENLPCMESLYSIVKEIDDQLNDNAIQIEKSVHDLLNCANDLPVGTLFDSFESAVQYIQENSILEKNCCFLPNDSEVSVVLNHILKVLETERGNEVQVYSNMIRFASLEGFRLPLQRVVPEAQFEDEMMYGSSELMALWKKICNLFVERFCEQLSLFVFTQCRLRNAFKRRSFLVFAMSSLVHPKVVWQKYLNIRRSDLDKIAARYSPVKISSTGHKQQLNLSRFTEMLSILRRCSEEDEQLLISGAFQNVISLKQLYCDPYIVCLFEQLGLWISTLRANCANGKEKAAPIKKCSQITMKRVGRRGTEYVLAKESSGEDEVDDDEGSEEEAFVNLLSFDDFAQLSGIIKQCFELEDFWEDELTQNELEHPVAAKENCKSVKGVLKKGDATDVNQCRSENDHDCLGSVHSAPSTIKRQLSHVEVGHYYWRKVFIRMEKEITTSINCFFESFVEQDIDADHQLFLLIDVCYDLLYGVEEYPRKVCQIVKSFVNLCNILLPVVKISDVMPEVKFCFYSGVNEALSNLLIHFNKLTALQLVDISALYKALASLFCVKSYMSHIFSVLAEEHNESRNPLALIHRQYSEKIDVVVQQIRDFHLKTLITMLQSVDLQSPSNKYQTYSASSSIRAWLTHIRSHCWQLFSILSQSLARNILTELLSDSLNFFVRRFSNITHSNAAIGQIRVDIASILKGTCDLLWFAARNLNGFVDSFKSNQLMFVHNLATSLLTILVYLTAPINYIHRHLKNGFPPTAISEAGYCTQWLSVIQPEHFEFPKSSCITDLPMESACVLALHLAVATETVNHEALLSCLLVKDCRVSRTFLAHAVNLTINNDGPNQPSILCDGLACLPSKCSLSRAFPIADVVQPFAYVIHSLAYIYPSALADVLLPILIETKDIHSFLRNGPLCTTIWANIYILLLPMASKIMESLLINLLEPVPNDKVQSFSVGLSSMPCGCRLRQKHKEKKETEQSPHRLQECIEAYIQILNTDYYNLSSSLAILFNQITSYCKQENIEIPSSSLYLYVLTRCCVHYLKSSDYVQEKILCTTLCKKEVKLVKRLKDALKKLICAAPSTDMIPAEIQELCSRFGPSIKSLATKLNSFVMNNRFTAPERMYNENVSFDLHALQFENLTEIVASSADGHVALLRIHQLLKANVKIIEKLLRNREDNIPEITLPICLTKNTERLQSPNADPIVNFNWDNLLLMDHGATVVSVRHLLGHRSEFSDAVDQPSDVAKNVVDLKSALSI